MTKRTRVVVGPAKGGGWDVNGPRGVQHFGTKAPAIDHGRDLAKGVDGNSQLVIKGGDGKIQTEHTYPRSSDPRKYPG